MRTRDALPSSAVRPAARHRGCVAPLYAVNDEALLYAAEHGLAPAHVAMLRGLKGRVTAAADAVPALLDKIGIANKERRLILEETLLRGPAGQGASAAGPRQ